MTSRLKEEQLEDPVEGVVASAATCFEKERKKRAGRRNQRPDSRSGQRRNGAEAAAELLR